MAAFRRYTTEELVGSRPDRERREQTRLPVVVVLDNVRSATNAGLVFRLAEHYAQQLRFWRLRSIELSIKSNATRE